jgi:hypothetical protein
MGKQFDNVACRYGAPMGRSSYGTVENTEGKISLFRVLLDQGYDDGGAYWGSATSYRDQLYCARSTANSEYVQFVRAESREAARRELGIPQDLLARPTKGKKHADRIQ